MDHIPYDDIGPDDHLHQHDPGPDLPPDDPEHVEYPDLSPEMTDDIDTRVDTDPFPDDHDRVGEDLGPDILVEDSHTVLVDVLYVTDEGWLDTYDDPDADQVGGVPIDRLDPDDLIPSDDLEGLRHELFTAPTEPVDGTTREAMILRALG